jgi:hypothetical protein
MKQLITILVIAAFLISNATAQKVGEVAPDFKLKTLNNSDYTLSANRGKVILVFFVGYGCPLCIASAPSVKSDLVNGFSDNRNFEFLIIDTWNGSVSSFNNFKNQTGLNGVYLQMGSSVATSWSTTYDRLAVIDAEGKLVFKGTRAARSDVNEAKNAVQNALNQVTTSAFDLQDNKLIWLAQNFPNPVLSKTTIEFSIPQAGFVTLTVSDITGKAVKSLINRDIPAGKHSVEFDASDIQNGIYFYRLDAGNYSSSFKMIVNK